MAWQCSCRVPFGSCAASHVKDECGRDKTTVRIHIISVSLVVSVDHGMYSHRLI